MSESDKPAEGAQEALGDPRTTGMTARYLLPYPIAALYQLYRVQHRPGLRYGKLLRLAEGIVEFLAHMSLADALGQPPSDKQVDKWLGKVDRPGMGTRHGLLRSTTKYLASCESPFVPELVTLIDAEWDAAYETLSALRNRFAHVEYGLDDKQAKAPLEELQGAVRVMLRKVQFLRHYHLGTNRDPKRSGEAFVNHWVGSRGQEEEVAAVQLRASVMLPEDVALLLDPRRDRAMVLTPFFHRALERTTGHMLVLEGFSSEDESRGHVTYGHPVLPSVGGVRAIADPHDTDATGLTRDEYRARIQGWHTPVTMGLDEASQKALTEPLGTASFEDHFEVIGPIGKGAMGTVYEVENRHMRKRTALKVLNAEHLKSEGQLRRFRREAEVLFKMEHPGIVRVHNMGVGSDNAPYIEMELLTGETLAERVARDGALSPEELEPLLLTLLDALSYVHDQGYLHRDIKPSNIMLTGGIAKLIDFGIAKVEGGTKLTETMSAMGTLNYMAPEQWSHE
ncbi:MAG: serine/threonine-protein kinase, partial [Myxococcota bacterium]|nr:serine/threonine-protein kinase [Myxococcota bacterium]